MENHKRPVLAPSILHRFKCKGAFCRYNCCQGWQISMTKTEYHRWKKCGILPKGKLENGIIRLCPDESRTDTIYAEIVLKEDQSCPYLTKDHLCQIQKKYGVKEMTTTCRLFPREVHSYFGHAERSLSLGCEKVLELLLEEKEGIFLTEEPPQNFEIYGSNYTIRHRKKYPKLKSYYDIQTLSFALLQSEEMSMENRLFLFGMAVDRIESLYAEGKEQDIPAYTLEFLQMSQHSDSRNILETFPNELPLSDFNSVMSALVTLGFPVEFRNRVLLKTAKATTHKKESGSKNPELEYFQECKERFRKWSKGKEYFFENIMVMCLLWLNIPFRDLEKSLWENYLYFVWIWIMLKGILCLSLSEDSTDEDMIDCCVMMFRRLGHNAKQYTDIIDAFREKGDTLAHIAILLRGC